MTCGKEWIFFIVEVMPDNGGAILSHSDVLPFQVLDSKYGEWHDDQKQRADTIASVLAHWVSFGTRELTYRRPVSALLAG